MIGWAVIRAERNRRRGEDKWVEGLRTIGIAAEEPSRHANVVGCKGDGREDW